MELFVIGVIGVLFGCGTYLLLQANLLQMIVGLSLFSHGANLALMVSGGLKRGRPPLLTIGAPYADPLPQALVLTAIVISFGVTAFALVLAFRTKQVCGSNDVDELAGGEE
ncbi:MAG: Na(+)/H(+) antiporter subunit C [Thermodesulfobacteriota bacterium]|jgi:multicomponent Na+:H+ antiporter subunit C